MTGPRAVGAVLAAGGSRRFGDAAKLLAPFHGRPLVSWAVDAALGAGLEAVAVVEGAVADLPVPPGVVRLANERWADGIGSSLAVAVSWAADRGADVLVVGLGDQPLVTPSAWAAVAAASAPVAVATYGGRRGNPVALAREVWPLLPVTGDEGARALMRERPELVVAIACEGDPADVDTVEDLNRWS